MDSIYAHSDIFFLEQIGAFVRHHRLQINMTQAQLAKQVGLNRYTVGQIEKGESITLQSLIQLLRGIQQLEVLSHFEISDPISPVAYAKLLRKERHRARPLGSDQLQEPEIEW